MYQKQRSVPERKCGHIMPAGRMVREGWDLGPLRKGCFRQKPRRKPLLISVRFIWNELSQFNYYLQQMYRKYTCTNQ